MAYKIILDPGHGGSDPGATFNGRQEKDEALGLAMSVGKLLENAGFDVAYTRTTDIYNTPFEKATIANNMGGDLFVSFHRNSAPNADMICPLSSRQVKYLKISTDYTYILIEM